MAFRRMTFALTCAAGAAFGAALAVPAAGQSVVQATPPPALGELQAALRTLARQPENQPALLRAGWAALQLDDTAAALGFFRRAEAVNPANGDVSAGLATIELRQGDPVAAMRLFAQAETQGAAMARFAADRGLALDLVGSNVAAQAYYRQALLRETSPEVLRRLALSLAISGDLRASEATLSPLLNGSDLAAYRTRAFALAIAGRGEEAVSIAQTMLPEALSNRMAPYLRFMPRLTRAQQAAAANLGRFPPAAEIGRDSPDIVAASGQQAAPARTADARLAPAGEPLGASARQPARQRAAAPAAKEEDRVVIGRVAQVTTTPLPAPVPPAARGELPPVGGVQAAPQPAPQRAADSIPPSAASEPVPSEELPSLAEAFADFSLPPAAAPQTNGDAVDISRITPPRERKVEPAPKAPAHPRRFWVQVATGRDVGALRWDWRRIKREGAGVLAAKDAHTAAWGQTNRLLTGPYPSASAAQDAVTALKALGVDSFPFTSADGEIVDPLR